MDETIRSYTLYGEEGGFPDLLHCEAIADRAVRHDWVIAPHRHPRLHQIFLISSGEVAMTVDGRALAPEPPVLINVPPRAVHGFRFSRGTVGHVLSLPPETLPEVFGPGSALAPTLARAGAVLPEPGLEAVMAELLRWQPRGGFVRAPYLRALAMQAACLAALALALGPESPPAPAQAPVLARFEALLARHLRDGWGVADYAAALGITPAHLTRLARSASGLPASRVIEGARMAEAARELAYTRKPVSEIAWGLGYDDPPYFARAFRRVTGRSPSDYRRQAGRAA